MFTAKFTLGGNLCKSLFCRIEFPIGYGTVLESIVHIIYNIAPLSKFQILTISENAFHHNSMLHTIYLSHNRLKSIPTELFQPLALLEDVYLENNQLQVIESAHFHGLVNLKRVRLQDNQLTSIGSEAFISSVSLSELYLESNRLETPERLDSKTYYI